MESEDKVVAIIFVAVVVSLIAVVICVAWVRVEEIRAICPDSVELNR
jgi:hypothetical protein